ncbi:MAG: phospholipid carrier-dependent glycosyltransferase, partial [Fimbriimonadales bacterium]
MEREPAQPSQPKPEATRRAWLEPAIVLALALALRLLGIGWGLKNDLHWVSYHPDEPVTLGYAQQIEPTKLDFDPNFYNYPTLYLTLLRVASDVVAAYAPAPDTPEGQWEHFSRCHLAGRLLSAMSGAGCALLAYLLVRRRSSRFGAWIAAAVVAVAPGHLMHSRFQSVDVMAAFWVALALFLADRLDGAKQPLRLSAWAGVVTGLAAGTKYTGVLALAAVWLAVWLWVPKSLRLRAWTLSGALAAVAFLIVTPGCIVNWEAFRRDFAYELSHSASGHGLVFVGYPSGFVTHLMNLAAGMGPLLAVLALASLALLLRERLRWFYPLALFAVMHYVVIGRAEVMFFRYTLPLFVPLAVAVGAWAGERHLRPGRFGRAWAALALLAVGGVDGGGAAAGVRVTSWMLMEDPRDQAARAIRSNSEIRSVGLVSDPWFYTPPMYPEVGLGPWAPLGARLEAMARAERPRVVRYLPSDPRERKDWDLRLLEELRPDAVVFTSFE